MTMSMTALSRQPQTSLEPLHLTFNHFLISCWFSVVVVLVLLDWRIASKCVSVSVCFDYLVRSSSVQHPIDPQQCIPSFAWFRVRRANKKRRTEPSVWRSPRANVEHAAMPHVRCVKNLTDHWGVGGLVSMVSSLSTCIVSQSLNPMNPGCSVHR